MDASAPAPAADEGGKLAANIMHFARVLRAAGLPRAGDRVLDVGAGDGFFASELAR